MCVGVCVYVCVTEACLTVQFRFQPRQLGRTGTQQVIISSVTLARIRSSSTSVPGFVPCCRLLCYNCYRAECSLTELHFSIRISFLKKTYITLLNINLFIPTALPCMQKPTEASAE